MRVKLFEVRDRATFIACFGILMGGESMLVAEKFLLRRSGFGLEDPLVLFGRLEGGECQYDPYAWSARGGRTVAEAHRYVSEHWDELESGAVIDVEYVLGETAAPKGTERER
jgi:hypothetical protein